MGGEKDHEKSSSIPKTSMQVQENDDEWTWESYSVSVEEESEELVKEPPKSAATSQAAPPSTPEVPQKLSKKELRELNSPAAKKAAELEAKRLEEEDRLRQIEERKIGIVKEKKETEEQIIRPDQLKASMTAMENIRLQSKNQVVQERIKNEWEQYLKCGGLPNPYNCGELSTYLHIWEKILKDTSILDASVKTLEVLKILDCLTTFIDDPMGVGDNLIENWKWVHKMFRVYQQESLDVATYRILRNVDGNMRRLDLTTSEFKVTHDNFTLSLWMLISLPTALPQQRKQAQHQIELDFPEMLLKLLFPLSITGKDMVVRAMYLKYDHLSDLCKTFEDPPMSKEFNRDLVTVVNDEWRRKLIYKYEQARKAQKQIPLADLPKEKRLKVLKPDSETIPTVPFQKLEPSPSMIIETEDEEKLLKSRKKIKTAVEEGVVNLRKYLILGGCYHINLYYQPPQPQEVVTLKLQQTRLQLPTRLYEVPFRETYTKPVPADPKARRDPEEIAAELKQMEEALEKFVLVTLTLPQDIIWLDNPIVCCWNARKKAWTTTNISDLKHIEEKGYITFRAGIFGCFSLASNRYCNFPFQAWELKSEMNGSVTFQITAAILMIEFNIKDNRICVSQLQNSPNDALQELVGVYYRFPRLKKLLRKGGVEVFPPVDTFCYVENTCEKHWPTEKHLYCNIAQLSVSYNFSWSRWNYSAGYKKMVLQMREYKPERTRQVPYSTLLVTPLKAALIECSEISQVFSDEVAEGMHFYADLYHLMKGICSMPIRNKVTKAPASLISTVAEVLLTTRVLSFS